MADGGGASGLRVPPGTWLLIGVVGFGAVLWLAYESSPRDMQTVQAAFDRLVTWGQLLLGASAGVGLLVAGGAYLLGRHSHGHRLAVGALAAVAIAIVGPVALHWFGLLVAHLGAQLPTAGGR